MVAIRFYVPLKFRLPSGSSPWISSTRGFQGSYVFKIEFFRFEGLRFLKANFLSLTCTVQREGYRNDFGQHEQKMKQLHRSEGAIPVRAPEVQEFERAVAALC